MDNTIATMSAQEFETLVEQAIDRRMSVWATQLMDALNSGEADEQENLRPVFAEALRRSIRQAEQGQMTSLDAFRQQLADG